jgi:hypothetical protein
MGPDHNEIKLGTDVYGISIAYPHVLKLNNTKKNSQDKLENMSI